MFCTGTGSYSAKRSFKYERIHDNVGKTDMFNTFPAHCEANRDVVGNWAFSEANCLALKEDKFFTDYIETCR